MMRLPTFAWRTPRDAGEVVRILAGEGPSAAVLAGGTDLLPNMKRRHQLPATLVSLSRVQGLREVALEGFVRLGAGVTLRALERRADLRQRLPALHHAVTQISTPVLRNMGTLGGNVCLDTRCNYYNQNYEWRQSIRFCMKAPAPHGSALTEDAGGSICWVAPASPRCWAVSSTDGGPMLAALGATVELRSKARGKRDIAVADLYNDDGMLFLKKAPDEVVTRVRVPRAAGQKSAYWKLRRRGSFDFPVLSVAAAATFSKSGEVTDARVVLGAVASMPLVLAESASLVGKPLTDDVIAEFAGAASRHAKPMDNTDFQTAWRRKVAAEFLTGALRELRGDDPRTMGQLGRRVARGASCLG